jgi:hypothetical protein
MIAVRITGPADLPALRTVFRRASLATRATQGCRAFTGSCCGDPTRRGVLVVDDLFVDRDWMGRGVAVPDQRPGRTRRRRRAPHRVEPKTHAEGFYLRVGFVVDGPVGTVVPAVDTAVRMHRELPD